MHIYRRQSRSHAFIYTIIVAIKDLVTCYRTLFLARGCMEWEFSLLDNVHIWKLQILLL